MEAKGEDGKIRQVTLIRAKYVRGLRYRSVGWFQMLVALELWQDTISGYSPTNPCFSSPPWPSHHFLFLLIPAPPPFYPCLGSWKKATTILRDASEVCLHSRCAGKKRSFAGLKRSRCQSILEFAQHNHPLQTHTIWILEMAGSGFVGM